MAKAASASKKPKGKKLLIVESPSKAKTINKFLGSSYKVIATGGHVRDLPSSRMAVDIENDFEPEWKNVRGKAQVIKELKKEAENASTVYIATDPDREGEAISWHLAFLLGIDPDEKCRVTFNEITKDAVQAAIKEPRAINMRLVDAQQARRVLDRLVGYSLSDLIQRKIRWRLSAGRVQSAALKIVCDREDEIKAFVPEEYWTITADFEKDIPFSAKLEKCGGEKAEIHDKEEADKIRAELEKGEYIVDSVDSRKRSVKPPAPFTTSTMQQAAGGRLNFSASMTMNAAQKLYESGLVTYIRTDSVRVADTARSAAAEYIKERYGDEYAYGGVRTGGNRKGAQDAHEAIRPTQTGRTPESLKDSLEPPQYKLYKLIWERFIASQMTDAVYDTVSAGIKNGRYGFAAKGSRLAFDGYSRVYSSGKREDTILPELEKGEKLIPSDLRAEQDFTQPPPRFTESSLIKCLEENGIGRPSTYAPIMKKLTEKDYVVREKKSLVPTELGFTVSHMIEGHFKEIVDVNFTSRMEEDLDRIEISDVEWKQVIRDFYGDFEKELSKAYEDIEKVKPEDRPTDEICEKCGRPMVIKTGRYGEFLACSGYPECTNTRKIVRSLGVKCPKCGRDIVERRSKKRGKIFYGCSGYPDCDQVYWYKPVNRQCPDCGSLLVERRSKAGNYLACSNEGCGYKERPAAE